MPRGQPLAFVIAFRDPNQPVHAFATAAGAWHPLFLSLVTWPSTRVLSWGAAAWANSKHRRRGTDLIAACFYCGELGSVSSR